MSFFLFLLLAFLIVFIVIPVIRLIVAISRAKAQARSMFENMFGGAENTSSGAGKGRRDNPATAPRRKKIDPEVGEYVEYEEIACNVTTTDSDGSVKRETVVEQQIVDVEWEDLPPAPKK